MQMMQQNQRYRPSMAWLWRMGVALLVWLPLSPALAQTNKQVQQIYGLLNRWRADEAHALAAPLIKRHPSSKILHYAMGRILYYQNKYDDAVKHFQKAATKKALAKDSTYHSLLATRRLTANYKTLQSPHFIIHYPPGPNEVLLPYAVQALEKAYHRLGKVYKYYPKHRTHIQILRNALELAEMSPLTKADIMRTGTIALCKYNRVMLTTPRSLLRGYRWLDTLIHEYTHLVINRIASGVPIWMHEGLARYSEILWRSDTPQPLSPYSETLLARAIKKDKLIPFKRMHPSMAKLPSQEDAALAYAQVYDLIKYFVKKHGQGNLPTVLRIVQTGKPVPKAFETVVKVPFKDFLGAWKNNLLNSGLREFKDIKAPKKVLKGQSLKKSKKQKQRELNFWTRPTDKKELGKRYLRLGEMLRAQRRMAAALFEYLKAEKYLKNRDPRLQNKIAISYLKIKQPAKAIPHLLESLKLYPSYVTTFVHLGKAYYASGQLKKARQSFEEVNQINPFHPVGHRYLISIFNKLKDPAGVKREQRIYRLLRKR